MKRLYAVIVLGAALGAGITTHLYFKHLRDASAYYPIKEALDKKNVIPVAIIGSGCAGYSAAIYGARADMHTVVIAGSQPGGQLSGTTHVDNWPGLLGQVGPDIIKKVREQGEHFGSRVLYQTVSNVDVSQWPFVLTTDQGLKLHALTIIIATGASPRKLGIPGEDELWGKGVTTCAICDAPFHKGSDVVVIGGGDSAAEEALQLAPYAKTVTLVVRKDHMRASAAMQQRLAEVSNISIMYNTEPRKIEGNGKVSGVELYNTVTNQLIKKPITGFFLAIGHEPNTQLFRNMIDLDEHGYIELNSRTQETNIPGIYAAGDVEDSRYRQAGVAAGSGIKAALDATNFLRDIGFNESISKALESRYFYPPKQDLKPLKQLKSIEEFDALLKEKTPLFVDFYTQHCPSCLQMLPMIEEIAHDMADAVTIVKADANELQDLADRYDISSVPALVAFKDGKEVKRSTRAMSRRELQDFFKQ